MNHGIKFILRSFGLSVTWIRIIFVVLIVLEDSKKISDVTFYFSSQYSSSRRSRFVVVSFVRSRLSVLNDCLLFLKWNICFFNRIRFQLSLKEETCFFSSRFRLRNSKSGVDVALGLLFDSERQTKFRESFASRKLVVTINFSLLLLNFFEHSLGVRQSFGCTEWCIHIGDEILIIRILLILFKRIESKHN